MSNYLFSVNWISPNATVTDITDRCILDRCGSINRGVAAADDLFAFTSGDLTLEANNQDGFFSDAVKSDPVDLSKLNSINGLIQVDIVRNGIRQFRGFVLPQSIKLDRLNKTAAFTVIGPMRLIDAVSAEQLARVFPQNLIVDVDAVEGAISIILSVDVPLLIGDTVSIGVEDSISDVISGYNSLTKTVTFVTPLSRDVARGETVSCLTPFPRNQDMFNLVLQLFGLGGIVNTNVQFTGLVGSRPFLTSFNVQGTGNVGELRGLKQAQAPGPSQRLVASLQTPGATTTTETASASPAGGFFPVAGSPVVMTIDGANVGNGGWKDFADQGGLAGEPIEGLTTANVFRKPMDSIKVIGFKSQSHATTRKTYDIVRTVGGQTFLYELSLTQSVLDNNNPEPGYLPDYEFGGLGALVTLKRYTTVNGGLAWVSDPLFVPVIAPNPVLVVTNPAATTYKYRVVAYNAAGIVISSSIDVQTLIGPNAALGTGTRKITVTWTAQPGAALYSVHRIVTGNGEATGRLVTTGLLTFADVGVAPISTDLGNAPGQFDIFNNPTFGGTGGAVQDWVLSAHPFLTGAGYDHVLYFSHWNGDVGVMQGTPDLRNTRLTINGGSPVAQTTVHFNAAGCKALFTRAYSAYTGVNRRVDFYYWDLSSGTPAIVHAEDNGVTHTVTAGQSIFNTGINPLIRHFKWNQVSGAGCRIFGLYSNGTSGTGYLILTPGNSLLGGFESLFVAEFQGVIDKEYLMLFDSTGLGPGIDMQVCTNQSSSFGPDFATTQNDSAHLATWTVTIGGSGSQKIMVGYAANVWFIASRFHTGFLSYADFTGMSASKALQEIAFVLNAFVNVDWQAFGPPAATDPAFGTFLSRDLPAPVVPKLLANLDGSKPASSFQDIVISADYDRAWSQSAPFVELTGSSDAVVATSGIEDSKQQGLTVEAKFVETPDLAQTIADTLFVYYGPGWPISQAPLVTPNAVAGITGYSYVIVATVGIDPRVDIKAISTVGMTNNGPVTLSGISFNSLVWSGTSGANWYHVYRVYSTGLGTGSTLGRLASLNGLTSYSDIGVSALTPPLPSRLKQPRQGAVFTVIDDLSEYVARGEVQFPDLLGHTDLGEPTASPVVAPDPTKPPRWWIENIDYNPVEATITLQVVEKDVPPL